MTPDLRKFLYSWLAWAEGDARDHYPYWRTFGLCANAPHNVVSDLYALLKRDFPSNPEYPFGGKQRYYDDRFRGSTHLNKKRLAWVRKQLEDAQ